MSSWPNDGITGTANDNLLSQWNHSGTGYVTLTIQTFKHSSRSTNSKLFYSLLSIAISALFRHISYDSHILPKENRLQWQTLSGFPFKIHKIGFFDICICRGFSEGRDGLYQTSRWYRWVVETRPTTTHQLLIWVGTNSGATNGGPCRVLLRDYDGLSTTRHSE